MESLSPAQQIAKVTGLKQWKVTLVLGKNSQNLHRVTDDEIAVILHAAKDLGYENKGRGKHLLGKKVKEVTQQMVARAARVSQNTVISAFKKHEGAGKITKETRQHVLNVAKELGYKPTHKSMVNDFERAKSKI